MEADWHERSGLRNDLWRVAEIRGDEEVEELRTRFEGDGFFEPIVEMLLGKPRGGSIRETRHVMSRVKEYMFEGGRLWKVGTRCRQGL